MGGAFSRKSAIARITLTDRERIRFGCSMAPQLGRCPKPHTRGLCPLGAARLTPTLGNEHSVDLSWSSSVLELKADPKAVPEGPNGW